MALTKLKIVAYKTQEYSGEGVRTFEVLINPETYQQSSTVVISDEQSPGTGCPDLRFKWVPAEVFSVKLLFDGTQLIASAPKSLKGKSVAEQIEAFKKITYYVDGSLHRPYFLQLSWGSSLFQGVLTELNITYKMFKPDGTPLRAEADVTFKSSSLGRDQALKTAKSSPDMTHVVKVAAGDTLPALCKAIYRDQNCFVQVAGVNGLNRLRSLKPGISLSFPALIKS